jgi:hypothetical protein
MRKRIPLARSARSSAAPPLEKQHCKKVPRDLGNAESQRIT